MRNSFFFGCLLILFSALVLISLNIADLVASAIANKPTNIGGASAHAAPSNLFAASQHKTSAVERIKSGEINCPHCDLSGADLSRQCVKHGNLTGANFDNAKAQYMCMSMANFTDASFRNADLTGANLGHSDLRGADLAGARLNITSIKGADLSTAKGLTQAQVDLACGDAETKLPAGLEVKSCS